MDIFAQLDEAALEVAAVERQMAELQERLIVASRRWRDLTGPASAAKYAALDAAAAARLHQEAATAAFAALVARDSRYARCHMFYLAPHEPRCDSSGRYHSRVFEWLDNNGWLDLGMPCGFLSMCPMRDDSAVVVFEPSATILARVGTQP